MVVLKVILIFVEVLTSALLVAVILLQRTKDEGLGLAFGGGVGETLFGSRAGNVLTRITIGLAVVFLVNTCLLAIFSARGTETSLVDRIPARPAAAQPVVPPEAPAVPGVPSDSFAPAPAAAPSQTQPVPAAPANAGEKAAPAANPAGEASPGK